MMPVFKVQYVRRGECEVEAATAEEADQAVRDMDANGDDCVSVGVLEIEATDEMIGTVEELIAACQKCASPTEIAFLFDEQVGDALWEHLYESIIRPAGDVSEPVRLIVNTLGNQFDVPLMKDY